MAINETDPSRETWWAMLHVKDFMHPGDSLHHMLLDLSRQLAAHEVWTVGLKDLSESGVEKARPTCWRFVAGTPIGEAVGGEVSRMGEVDPPRLTGLLRGPELTVGLGALEHVRKLSNAQCAAYDEAEDYDVCILNIPGLVMETFWLRCKSKASGATWDPKACTRDLIVPFLTMSRKIERLRPYPVNEFLAIVGPLAKAQLDLEHKTTAE